VSDTERPPPIAVAAGTVSALLLELAHAPPREMGGALPSLRPGQTVGGFEVVREIGRGGFGVVYEARDLKQGRMVALKALRIGGTIDPKEERLLREADAAARLSHPNIVTVLDAGHWVTGPFLVLELLRGQTLGELLAQGPIPVRDALRIGVEVARGVAHAHAEGVIHRDLTPGNVFLCDGGPVKVLDFGMAHAFGRRKLEGGTRAYMAPEQRRGAPEDERTDVFALGIVMHQMLSGELPFPEEGALRRDAKAPRLEISGMPALGALIARMLELDPVDRPRDAEQVLTALTGFRQHLERDASSGSSVRARRPASGWTRIGAGTALAALVVGGAYAWMSERPSRTEAAGASLPRAIPQLVSPNPEVSAGPPPAPAAGGSPEAPPVRPPERPHTAPDGRIVDCRASIGAVPTPPRTTGDGVLTIVAEPFGNFFVNGRAHGETPGECRVSAGTYSIRVVHPQLGARAATVKVRPGQRTTWTADFLEQR